MGDHRQFAGIFAKFGYVSIKKIGEGSFGMAVLVEDKDKHQAVCKMIHLGRATKEEIQDTKREANLLAALKHKYIVRYREALSSKGCPWFGIVMDFCAGGDIDARVNVAKAHRSFLEEEDVAKWTTQMALAMKYLHAKNVLHRDLKPANLFLTADGDIQVGDFGVSKALPNARAQARTQIGTPYYMAPELIQAQPYSLSADIWSMGCIVYQMCALRVPFEAQSATELARKIVGGKPPPLPGTYSAELQALIAEMMNRKAKLRPIADAIIKRPVIQRSLKTILKKSEEKKKAQQDAPAVSEKSASMKFVLLDQFRDFDVNGDGQIDRNELLTVLRHIDASVWTDERVDALLRSADGNRDGTIQFDEFVQWVFGGDGMKSLAERVQSLLHLAQQSVEAEKLPGFKDAITCCRQAVDLGCLRVAPPELCQGLCDKLAWLAMNAGILMDSVTDDDAASLALCYDSAKQLRAVLHGVEQLLAESKRPHIRAVAVSQTRVAVKGICFELTDGRRFGSMPGGLSDVALQNAHAKWEIVELGERILQVTGFGMLSSNAHARGGKADKAAGLDDGLVSYLELCTDRRKLTFGATMGRSRGSAFDFQAGGGTEIEQVSFADGLCVGVETVPFVCRWPVDVQEQVRQSFRPAADAVLTTLLRIGWRMGLEQGKHALLQARRLRLQNPYMPDAVKAEELCNSIALAPPAHWDLSVMDNADKELGLSLNVRPGCVDLSQERLQVLQQLLDATWVQIPRDEAVRPGGIELVRGSMLQNWKSWVSFCALQETIQTDLTKKTSEEPGSDDVGNVKTEGCLGDVVTDLDQMSRTKWLFHSCSVAASKLVTQTEFDIDHCATQDGKIYGRGLYFTECSSRADELSPNDDAGLHCMLLCRVSLGKVVTDTNILPDVCHLVDACVGGPYHSVCGDRRVRCPDAGAFREFVVYDKDQVYPELLLWYRRTYK